MDAMEELVQVVGDVGGVDDFISDLPFRLIAFTGSNVFERSLVITDPPDYVSDGASVFRYPDSSSVFANHLTFKSFNYPEFIHPSFEIFAMAGINVDLPADVADRLAHLRW